jgi:hypothetical protein
MGRFLYFAPAKVNPTRSNGMLNGDRRPLQGCCGIATLAAFRFAAGYLSNGIPLNWNARDPSRLASEGKGLVGGR